jgi:hypothetical protein
MSLRKFRKLYFLIRNVRVGAPRGVKFSPLHNLQTRSADNPAFYPVPTGFSFPGGKAAGREANHSLPVSAWVHTRALPTFLDEIVLN